MKEALARAAAAHPELPAPDAAFERGIASKRDEGTLLAELQVADLFLAFDSIVRLVRSEISIHLSRYV